MPWLDLDRIPQAELRSERLVIGSSATDRDRKQAILATKVVDGFDTAVAVLRGNFI
jgi:hypothetical protein